MHQIYGGINYYEDEKVQIISLPYLSNKLKFEMIIILPNLKMFSSPLDYLNKENIKMSEIYSKLEYNNNVHLFLPKFKYEFEIDLKEILNNMGMNLAFSENAEFDNLCKNIDILVDQILHKTFIKVNENGTLAAAVTLTEMNTASGPPNSHEEEYYMNVNHSFIYMIQSKEIKDIEDNYLMPFIGIVNELEKKEDEGNYTLENNIDKDNDDSNLIESKNYEKNLKINLLIIFMVILINS